MKTDVLVLGAGMVGISAALHLQARGRTVVLADRRGAAEETSYGNAGLIQREGVVPHAFPRDISRIVRAALGRSPEAHIHLRALPELAPFLWAYWKRGTPDEIARTAHAARPLIERVITEHEALMEAAGISHMLRRTGYIKLYRNEKAYAAELAADEATRARYGVTAEPKSDAELHALEPHLQGTFAGGILLPQPASVPDPGAVGKAYAELLVQTRRPAGNRGRDHAGAGGRRMAPAPCRGRHRGRRGGHCARPVEPRRAQPARRRDPDGRQARLSHAVCTGWQCRVEPAGA